MNVGGSSPSAPTRLFLAHTPPPEGALLSDGSVNGCVQKTRWACAPLVDLYGDTLAAKWSVKDFRTYRAAILSGSWRTSEALEELQKQGKDPGWSIRYANEACYNILRLFDWLESQEHIPPGRHQNLVTMRHVTAPAQVERQIVPDEELEPKRTRGLPRPQIHRQ